MGPLRCQTHKGFSKGIPKGGVKNRNKGGCKRLFAFVHVCSRLLAFGLRFRLCVCSRLSTFYLRLLAFACAPLLLRPPLRDTDFPLFLGFKKVASDFLSLRRK